MTIRTSFLANLFILLALLSSCSSEKKIKSITVVESTVNKVGNNNQLVQSSPIYKTSYDTAGNVVRETTYNSHKQKTEDEGFYYTNGLLMRSIKNGAQKDYKYDEQNLLQSVTYQNKYVLEKYYYNQQLLARMESYAYDGSLTNTIYYKYNDQNLLIEEKTIEEDYIDWFEYQYDENGNKVAEYWFDSMEGPLEKTEYLFTNNTLAHEIWINFYEGKPQGSVEYFYTNGLEMETIDSDFEDGTIIKTVYEYEFDAQNNWIKCTETTNDGKTKITERLIEYF